MASEAYELLALLMRYVFVLIGALVLWRAYRWMRRDARNYRREMRALPDAGLVGEIVDLKTGRSQPLPREGDMGTSRECDIRVKGNGVLRHHCRFAFEEGKGMLITPSRRGKVFMGGQKMAGPGHALHGTQLQLGDAQLRVRLFAGLKVPQPAAFQTDGSLFDTAPGAGDALLPETDDFSAFSFAEKEETLSPFDFPDDPLGAPAPQAPLPPSPPASYGEQPPMPPAVPYPPQDYEGNYTEDGQMTWQYAYSLEELYRAEAEMNRQAAAADSEENDEALPYESPIPRRKRRSRG